MEARTTYELEALALSQVQDLLTLLLCN